MVDTNVESQTRSLAVQDGSGTQLSVRDAVLRSTGIDLKLFEGKDQEKLLLVMMFLFKGVLDNTFNGDVVTLAKYRAADLLEGAIDKSEVFEIATDIVLALRRKRSAIDSMF